MDGLGQTGSDRSGEHAEDSVINGSSAPWANEAWSSAGSALEPSFEPLNTWNATVADRRGIEALSGHDPADTVDDALTSTLVQPKFTPFRFADSDHSASLSSTPEDPYADELAQRSAEFARHAAFDDPTPPQGMPLVNGPPPVAWAPPAAPVHENGSALRHEDDTHHADPPLAAQLSLGQRFGMAFPGSPFDAEPFTDPAPAVHEPVAAPAVHETARSEKDDADEPEATLEELPQRIPGESEVPPSEQATMGLPVEDKLQLSRIASHLRRDDVPEDRPDGFDVEAVLEAVRTVAGVREATLRTTPTGAHHLRLELAEGADPGTISRMVARMLEEQMGLDAALTGPPGQLAGIPAQTERPEPAPLVLPGPRTGPGAAPPPAVDKAGDRWNEPPHLSPVRESRRRHPVSVPRRPPGELRPSERAAATWKAAAEADQPPGAVPPPIPTEREQGPRAIIEHVQTSTFGLDATVEVRLTMGDRLAAGVASGPAVDGYVLRLCAAATAAAVDDLLSEGTSTGDTGRCFVEHAALVPMASCDVAVVVVLLVCGGWVEQLAGSALVSGDPRRAVVRATLAAVNRRLAALLP